MEFNFGFGKPAPSRQGGGDGNRPLRLLVLGDFSAKPSAERPPLAGRPTHRVDIDSLDAVMQRLAPALKLPAGDVDFTQLDDFHPDALYQRLELFDALRQARAKPPSGGGGDLLGQLLGKTESTAAAPAPAATGLDALIRNIVAPHIVQDTSATVKPYIAAVDAAITEQMRKLLHDPAFQALEGAWRGVQWLISSLELDENLELHLFDISRDELLADIVAAQGQLAQTGLYHALADRWRNVPGASGWSLLTGLYRFGPSDTDIGLLAALGMIASQAGGPFVAGGDPALAGDDEAALQGWNTLRRSEAAPWIGLAAPRVLLRLPYGKRSDAVVSFAFEECDATPVHEEFLWGPGSLAVALLIGRAFTSRGWEFEPGDEREISDLPAYTYLQGGERELQACAEQYLGEQGGNALLAAGLMPVLSHRHANAVSVMRFQSVAEPAGALAGLSGSR
jgi:type VI secretion system protein ImpC